MNLRKAATTLALIGLCSVPGQAQINNVSAWFKSGSVAPDPGVISHGPTGGSYYVGPYSGTLTLGATTLPVIFNCVDFFHDVALNQRWTATLTNLGNGAGIGTTNANSATRLYGSVTVNSLAFTALDVYRAAAYLTSTYPAARSTNKAATIAIQNEIWQMTSLFYPQIQGEASYYATQSTRTDGYSYAASKTAAQLASDLYNYSHVANFDYSNFWVVTSSNPSSDLKASPQEFIINKTIATPEPGTLMLLGSGMLSMLGGGFVRRRRTLSDKTSPPASSA
jgi:hypothetical protein